MGTIILAGLLAAALTVAMPAVLVPESFALPEETVLAETAAPETEADAAETETAAPETTEAETGTAYYDDAVTVRLLDQGTVTSLTLHDYLVGVVLQEMPASFETEALKAQAVAARTFTVRLVQRGGAHENADVCGDPACCQCYLSEEEGAEVYGDGYEAAMKKVESAVEATDGEVIVCDGDLIEAVYFSSTGGSTEAAAAVWGGEISYLQPVSSPESAEVTEQKIPLETFRQALPKSDLTGNPASWFGETAYTAGGAVDSMTIGGVSYSGTTLRSIFSLPSARFRVAVTADSIVFEVTGSGHGVGMSQYGANTMAAAGQSYLDILLHYYTGTEIRKLS
ncbi:MAG: stage II sporulation protein D [Oscillospiraceae bacterium]|nr:stage II sporulation protein D [Oscillospiraceae bacterium]